MFRPSVELGTYDSPLDEIDIIHHPLAKLSCLVSCSIGYDGHSDFKENNVAVGASSLSLLLFNENIPYVALRFFYQLSCISHRPYLLPRPLLGTRVLRWVGVA
jgi:hypothetical protein